MAKPTITFITDTFTTLVKNLNTISLDLGNVGALNTNEDSDAVGAINELELAIRGVSNNLVDSDLTTFGFAANNIVSALRELDSDLHGSGGGNAHSDLNTTAKNLTGAINEHDTELVTITSTAMGTTASTVSAAIRELYDAIQLDSNGLNNNLNTAGVYESLISLDNTIGDLADLSTQIANRSDLVESLNSQQTQLDILDANGVVANQKLGLLADLDSAGFVGAERNNFVAALNALRADVPLIFDVNGTQLN